jgi:phosphinothricin acetyltransferase
MAPRFERLGEIHRHEVMDLFNHWIEHSLAAYPLQALPHTFFDHFLAATEDYPAYAVRDEDAGLVGFGILRAWHPLSTFDRCAEIGYFLHPDHCGRGIGSRLLTRLLREGRDRGIATVLASIAAGNQGSIRFHQRHGFTECGRFRRVGSKHGEVFDVVWMQRSLEAGTG